MTTKSLWERYLIKRGQRGFRIVAPRYEKPKQQKYVLNQKEKIFRSLGEYVFFSKLWGSFTFIFLLLSLPIFPESIAAWDLQILKMNDFQLLSDFNPFLFAGSLFFAIFWLDSAFEVMVCKEVHSTKHNAKIRVYEKG